MKPLKIFFACLCTVGFLEFLHAASPIQLDIERSGQCHLGLAPFASEGADSALKIFQDTLAADLRFSRLFQLVENGPVVKGRADVEGWTRLGVEFVFEGHLSQNAKGELDVHSTLYDASSLKEVLNINEKKNASEGRRLAHEVANQLVHYFTSQPGIFTSRIVFVNDGTGRKELYSADYDGANVKRLTNDNSIVVLPRLSPNGEKIIFTSYMSGNPDLYLMNANGGGRKKISSKAGLNVSPSWLPNNQGLAVTLSHNGPPNIYLMDLQGTVQRQLTDAPGADTAPTFSPDGNQMAFTSDRSGRPNIYVMNVDGSGVRRLTSEGHCDSAAWSPDGQRIAYVKGFGKDFDIYSIEVLTGVERRLTWGQGNNENPSWSPDGRFILFVSNRRKKWDIFVMAANGEDQKPILINKGQSFTPHWSVGF